MTRDEYLALCKQVDEKVEEGLEAMRNQGKSEVELAWLQLVGLVNGLGIWASSKVLMNYAIVDYRTIEPYELQRQEELLLEAAAHARALRMAKEGN